MATGAQIPAWSGPSRRRVPRFRIQAPLDVTVLRSGIPDTVPGRSVNVCERGIAAMIAGELVPGESVGVEVRLSEAREPLRTRATVRYQDRLQCGLEFVAMSVEQRAAIRDWAKEARAETQTSSGPVLAVEIMEKREVVTPKGTGSSVGPMRAKPGRKWRGVWWLVVLVVIAATAVFWWRWNRAWEELESGLKNSESASSEKPRAQVPAEVMQKLLVHRVEPVYPAEARKEKLEGIIALDIVVGRDGTVISMRALNGPDVLARAAMDALRWWKFEPYRVNGEPAVVETTVAVEFKNRTSGYRPPAAANTP
ncbi:MAG TPA: TonB family protein [Candidatus Dormibacteraeota bacterium]|nr:TonB family protein [Candidatus Dormibacteraeota bacterium]